MNGRLREEMLDRLVDYGDRILALAERMENDRRPRRLVDQLIGSGTSSGANLFEAHEAISKADFVKCLGWSAKELSETKLWLKLIIRRRYFDEPRVAPLLTETDELLAIVKTLIARVRRGGKPPEAS